MAMATTATDDSRVFTFLVKPLERFAEKILHGFPELSDLKRRQAITRKNRVAGIIYCQKKTNLAAVY